VSVKLPQSVQPSAKSGGKQAAAVAASADTPVFEVTPARCTIQPGSHVFATVTFSPLSLQVRNRSVSSRFAITAAAVSEIYSDFFRYSNHR